VCCAAYRHAFKQYTDRTYSDAELEALFGPNEEGIIRSVLADRPALVEGCLQSYLTAYARLHGDELRPFPGVERALRMLSEHRVPVALVIGKGARSAAISLERLHLLSYFDIVEVGSPDGAIRPFSIRRVLERWRVAADRVAYVGDAAYDMQAAREAGVLPVSAAWAPKASSENLAAQAPLAVFSDLAQFVAWLGCTLGRASSS